MSEIISLGQTPFLNIPTLETKRLRLRAHELSDLSALSEIWANPDTTRFIGNQTRTREDLWKQIQRSVGGWAILGYGYWVITLKDTGQVIGEAGLMEGLRDITPPFTGTPEAGWVVSPDHWNKGYASEVLGAMHSWSDANIPGKRTVCMIEPDHAASIHLAHKAGYRAKYDTHIGYAPIRVFERTG